MGYALFAQRKLALDMQLNMAQLEQTMASNAQYALATKSLSLNQELASTQSGQSQQLAAQYEKLSGTSDSAERQAINDKIAQYQKEFDMENDKINQQIYQVSVAENAIEMTVKRLDTMVTALQKQLEAVEQAEGQAIDRATPHFKGLG
jgi:predicted nuclease with TOPRIM domain